MFSLSARFQSSEQRRKEMTCTKAGPPARHGTSSLRLGLAHGHLRGETRNLSSTSPPQNRTTNLLQPLLPHSTFFSPKYLTHKSTRNDDDRRTELDNATISKQCKESARTIEAAPAYTELLGTFMQIVATRAQVTALLSRTGTDLVFLRKSDALVHEIQQSVWTAG